MMKSLSDRFTILVILTAVLAVAGFAAFHVSCHSGTYHLCPMAACALIFTATGVVFTLGVSPLIMTTPANRGESLHFPLDRPPRI